MTAVLEATGLVKRVTRRGGTRTVLDGVALCLGAGTVTGLVGPSLSGKTTLIGILAGWDSADAGEIVRTPAGAGRVGLTVIPQGFALLDELSVDENIRLAERTGGVAIDPARVASVTQALGITHLLGRLADEISVGERQRAMAARALVGRPLCVLADDPVAHQDERHAHAVLALLRAAADDGAACLIATRTPQVVERIADAVVHLPGPR